MGQNDNPSISGLPILDLSRFTNPGTERQGFIEELRHGARNIGFFYLTGHGVDDDLAEQVFSLSRRFFDLPQEEKLAIEMVNSPHFRGYTPPGKEYTRGSPDWREELDVGLEVPALKLTPIINCQNNRKRWRDHAIPSSPRKPTDPLPARNTTQHCSAFFPNRMDASM